MKLLDNEFNDGPDGSISGMLKSLVSQLRLNRSNISAEEFRQRLPALINIEATLQEFDQQIGQPARNYIEEIMAELDLESDDQIQLVKDLERATKAIVLSFRNQEVDFNDFDCVIGKSENYGWVKFGGYVDQRPVDSVLILAKEIARAICYKYNYAFIDLS